LAIGATQTKDRRKREKRACAIKQSAIDQNPNMTHNFIMTVQLQHVKVWFDFFILLTFYCVHFAGQEWDTETIIMTAYIFFSFYVAEKEFILQMY